MVGHSPTSRLPKERKKRCDSIRSRWTHPSAPRSLEREEWGNRYKGNGLPAQGRLSI